MKIILSGKNIKLDDPLKVFVEEKIGSLDKTIGLPAQAGNDSVKARVEIGKPSFHHRSGPVFYAEVNLDLGGELIRAENTDIDLRTAITNVRDELRLQIQKFKEKNKDKSLKDALKIKGK